MTAVADLPIDEVMALMSDWRPRTSREVAEAVGCSVEDASSSLSRLRRYERRIEKVGHAPFQPGKGRPPALWQRSATERRA